MRNFLKFVWISSARILELVISFAAYHEIQFLEITLELHGNMFPKFSVEISANRAFLERF